MVEVYRMTENAVILRSYLNKLDQFVQSCAYDALCYNALDMNNPKFFQWAQAAEGSLQEGALCEFVHARYGYAVEEMVNEGLAMLQQHLPDGCRQQTQVTVGNTRPDIVIFRDVYQLAWIDITSEMSITHIKNKDGSGWASRDCVCEIAYPTLKLENIRWSNDDSIASRAKFYARRRRNAADARKISAFFIEKMRIFIQHIYSDDDVSRSRIAKSIKDAFKCEIGYGKHAIIHSLLEMYVELDTYLPYGEAAKEIIYHFYRCEHHNKSGAIAFLMNSYNYLMNRSNVYFYFVEEPEDEEDFLN